MVLLYILAIAPRLQSWAHFAEISGAESLGKISAGAQNDLRVRKIT